MTYPTPPPPFNTGTEVQSAALPAAPGWLANQRLANWPRRTLATLIDVAVTVYLPSLVVWSTTEYNIVVIVLVGLNSVFFQARTYQSLGKLIMGVFLARPVLVDGHMLLARPTYGRCVARVVLHLLDTLCFVGFLRPIWDRRRQTFADSIAHTVVGVGPKPVPYSASGGARNLA